MFIPEFERLLVKDAVELNGLFEPGVVALAAPIDAGAFAALTAREAELVMNAVPKRRNEFATGRALARLALGRLARHGVELLNAADRAPIWPEGIRGTISHSNASAVVAVTERSWLIGIDVEHRPSLPRELWEIAFRHEERRRLDQDFTGAERERMALVAFSAKESFYKAQYPCSKAFLGFEAVSVRFLGAKRHGNRGRFECTLEVGAAPFARGATFYGRYHLDAIDGEVITAVQIEEPTNVDVTGA